MYTSRPKKCPDAALWRNCHSLLNAEQTGIQEQLFIVLAGNLVDPVVQ